VDDSLSIEIAAGSFTEILLLVTAYLIPWVLALPFYGLELLIGFIQGLIFAGLTLVFAAMAVTSHEEESHSVS